MNTTIPSPQKPGHATPIQTAIQNLTEHVKITASLTPGAAGSAGESGSGSGDAGSVLVDPHQVRTVTPVA